LRLCGDCVSKCLIPSSRQLLLFVDIVNVHYFLGIKVPIYRNTGSFVQFRSVCLQSQCLFGDMTANISYTAVSSVKYRNFTLSSLCFILSHIHNFKVKGDFIWKHIVTCMSDYRRGFDW
jgi:hypothetical protein